MGGKISLLVSTVIFPVRPGRLTTSEGVAVPTPRSVT